MISSIFSVSAGTVMLIIIGLCTVITAVCVALDGHEGRSGFFMLKHAGTSIVCRLCALLALFFSIYWTIYVPVNGLSNLVLLIWGKVVIFCFLWLCLAFLFAVVWIIVSRFTKH